ncbi:hypothetical protein A2U01_0103842, partial [Trifolium medium]|nr:hypothetical protein [Trifolium medium]
AVTGEQQPRRQEQNHQDLETARSRNPNRAGNESADYFTYLVIEF